VGGVLHEWALLYVDGPYFWMGLNVGGLC
jgi:hypothetical protein